MDNAIDQLTALSFCAGIRGYIRDCGPHSPLHNFWRINTRTDFKQIDHDYGFVAGFHDPTTDQAIVVVAGIGEEGTVAASELLTEEKYLSEAKREGYLPKQDQNWEAVLETKMMNGKPGPPRILASYAW